MKKDKAEKISKNIVKELWKIGKEDTEEVYRIEFKSRSEQGMGGFARKPLERFITQIVQKMKGV